MQTLYLLIILALLGYIIFLHILLVRKNIFIESTVKRITGIEKDWKMDELLKFLEEIKKLSLYTSFFNDKLFENKNLTFILENVNDSKIYIHYTKEEADAKSIITNGFRFADSFYKTALPVTNDKLDLIIKHNSRKYFGDYLLIICISNELINEVSGDLEKAGVNNYFIETILTETPPVRNENSDFVRNENSDFIYLLPKQFIKGYINIRTGEITNNPDFNPKYYSRQFKTNIEEIKNKAD
jgi:hypothetical protein